MGLFGIGKELQFGICSYGKAHASPYGAWEGEGFYTEEREVGRAVYSKQSQWLFMGWVLARKEEAPFSFLGGSDILSGHENCPFLVSQFYLIGVYLY